MAFFDFFKHPKQMRKDMSIIEIVTQLSREEFMLQFPSIVKNIDTKT